MREDGRVHPAEATRPALKSEDRRYYDAYRSLSACRIWSQIGPDAIQVSEVLAYMEMASITDPETRLKYLRLVQGLDLVELKHIRSKTKAT